MLEWLFVINDKNRAHLCKVALEAIQRAPAGFVLTIREAKKSRDQENKYHAMITDIAKACQFLGRKWSAQCWKRILIDAFVQVQRDEALANGEADPFPEQGQCVPSLDGRRIVQLGVQSRDFSRGHGSDFIEYLYAYGESNAVAWSPKSRRIIAERPVLHMA